MANFLPPPPVGIPPGLPLRSGMAVDPSALAAVPAGLGSRAQELRSGAPALFSAWDQVAAGLAGERTGEILASARPGSAAALEACAATVEALASGLRRSAGIYADAEAAAGAVASVGDRTRAWMP